MKKKLLALLLTGAMMCSLAACGQQQQEETEVLKIGKLASESMGGHRCPEQTASTDDADLFEIEFVFYDNLSAALLDLNSGKVAEVLFEESSAAYIVSHNDNCGISAHSSTGIKTDFSMMTLKDNTEVYDTLNNAIAAIKADGTMQQLIQNDLKAYIETDPEPAALPHFEGAETITIGITGDLPPMDFVSASGKAAGFNVALLSEIANRAKVNFELVQIETGARALALSTGKVDAVFWTKSSTCELCGTTITEKTEDVLLTESYFSESACLVNCKSQQQ